MLLEDLFENLALRVEPFAMCTISSGWRLRMERLEWVTLHYVLSGEGQLTVGNRPPEPFGPYSVALVPQKRTHALQARGRATREAVADDRAPEEAGLLQFVAGPDGDQRLKVACGRLQAVYAGGLGLFDLMDDAVVLSFSDSEVLKSTMARMLEESRRPTPGSRAMIVALMNECLVWIFRRLCGSPECTLPWLNALDDARMARVVSDVLEHPQNPHTLDSLAVTATMSRSAFSEAFKASFGQTPMGFVRDVRLRRAAKLLRSSKLPVDAICGRVGYASRSHFSYAFRDYFGLTPTEFRVGPG